MFDKTSRYKNVPTVVAKDAQGREVMAVKLRPLPATPGEDLEVMASDQLDVIAERCYRDPTRFWHIADANSELEAEALLYLAGRLINVPRS
jgi:hypothetical protein